MSSAGAITQLSATLPRYFIHNNASRNIDYESKCYAFGYIENEIQPNDRYVIPRSSDIITFRKLFFYNCSDDFTIRRIIICISSLSSTYNIIPADFAQFIDNLEETFIIRSQTCKIFHLDKLGLHLEFIMIALGFSSISIKVDIAGTCDTCKLNIKQLFHNSLERRRYIEHDFCIPITTHIKMSIAPITNGILNIHNNTQYSAINGLILTGFNNLNSITSMTISLNITKSRHIFYNDNQDIIDNCTILNKKSLYIPFNSSSYSDIVSTTDGVKLDMDNNIHISITTTDNDDLDITMYAYVHNELKYIVGYLNLRYNYSI